MVMSSQMAPAIWFKSFSGAVVITRPALLMLIFDICMYASSIYKVCCGCTLSGAQIHVSDKKVRTAYRHLMHGLLSLFDEYTARLSSPQIRKARSVRFTVFEKKK